MKRQFKLKIGTKYETLEIPFENIVEGKIKCEPQCIEDLNTEVKNSLVSMAGNVDTNKLNSDCKVVIVSDDYTRPTPTKKILPGLLNFLANKGVKKEKIDILIGAGVHREMTKQEKVEKFGKEICDNYKIYHHNALEESNLCYLGETKTKIPIYINKIAVEADFLIGIGVVEIHPWAGFAGGPKIICPGVAGKKTINYTHSIPVTHKNVEIGVTLGNPFWESIREAAKMAGLDMVVNVVLDRKERVCAIFSGEAEAAQKRCIEIFKSFNEIVFDEPADIVITTSNPKFQYWGQAAIAGYNADAVIKEGGTRIIVAACPEGFGDSQQEIIFYFDSLRNKWENLDRYWEEKQGIMYDNSRNACAVHRHLRALKKSDMIMVTRGLPTSTPNMKSQKVVGTLDEAIKMVLDKYGKEAKVIVYDMGAMVLPIVSGCTRIVHTQ